MHYYDGTKIQLADRVKLGNSKGKVAALIGEGLYESEYLSKDWSYLKHGLLIYFDKYGLIYYVNIEQNISFIERGLPA
ncbi:hypothetical protein [Neisseria zalophi]|uniref:Uncharacterized protein n=1 Tax=Neisseria zalophi TaxID=640030 RepID=A0A5J6PU53_9NEIS|nr:hypothetical protein [Neisseria zalophi]QEY26179.1 hypothetical protein D0T92_06330 [Neisseria zalophi]